MAKYDVQSVPSAMLLYLLRLFWVMFPTKPPVINCHVKGLNVDLKLPCILTFCAAGCHCIFYCCIASGVFFRHIWRPEPILLKLIHSVQQPLLKLIMPWNIW